MEHDVDYLVASYLRYQATGESDLAWVDEEISSLIVSEPEDAWRIIRNLCARASKEETLEVIGRGPLTELIENHSEYRELAAEAAERAPNLRLALLSVK